jgi:hypothetical protein
MVYRPEPKGCNPQTVGMVRLRKGQTKLIREDYLELLAKRVQALVDQEDNLPWVMDLLRREQVDVGDYPREKMGQAIVDGAMDHLYRLKVTQGLGREPIKVSQMPDFEALARLEDISLEEWLGALTYTGPYD